MAIIFVTDGGDSNSGTLRDAISNASIGDTILIEVDNVSLTSGELEIIFGLTIKANNSSGHVTITQNMSGSRVFYLNLGSRSDEVTMENLTITGGDAPNNSPGGVSFCQEDI